MILIMRVFPLILLMFMCSCASGPKNTTGAAYDADSSYCRELVEKSNQPTRISSHEAFSPNHPPHSDQQLYEQMCEPVGAWQARDQEGHDSTVAYENSLFRKILKVFR